MSDISQIKLGTTVYNIKDSVSRQDMISNKVNSDVNAVVNFVNGLRVGGQNVISQATAEVISISADEAPSVTVSVDQSGIAHFSFNIPKSNKVSMEFIEDGIYLDADVKD